ncbi:hypothetical protein [Streptomyces sp. EN16]|uniref:hypothetical protein n=1 Tax=Streptomyces sp. EN16 TaxID=212773 RepID=UPI000851EF8C|nr:hypothetical protein [Streptomyces sp. EN16]
MSDRQFKDRDGDTWTEFEPGMLRLMKCAGDRNQYTGIEDSIEDVQADHGPLTEIRPDVDVRALLAGAFDGLAEELRKTTDLPRVLEAMAKRLREESA